MIYTRFGCPVTIIDVNENQSQVTIQYNDAPKDTKEIPTIELKADGGWSEVQQAMESV